MFGIRFYQQNSLQVLSECAASTFQLPSNLPAGKPAAASVDNIPLSGMLLDYVKDMCTFLESVDKSESLSGNQQALQQVYFVFNVTHYSRTLESLK